LFSPSSSPRSDAINTANHIPSSRMQHLTSAHASCVSVSICLSVFLSQQINNSVRRPADVQHFLVTRSYITNRRTWWFPQRWCWRFTSSGLLHCVAVLLMADVSKERVAIVINGWGAVEDSSTPEDDGDTLKRE
jgi:hypothetical protein